MTRPLRLIIFDVDGTLIDSQASIMGAMQAAFASEGLPTPERAEVLSIVGLSLDRAFAQLAAEQTAKRQARLVQAYKDAFAAQRLDLGASQAAPLYPGTRDLLDQLSQIPENILGIATGKSRRGLDALLDGHDLRGLFSTTQVADHHPSKPHPSMIEAAMRDVGVDVSDTVMIGDTSFDMDMAASAGVAGIGVTWGYHHRDALGAARCVVEDRADIPGALRTIWKTP
ncbi:HAD-IA family hydrolase [Thalassococcus sp. S3]|uniref:HAD-IA family hydrolase n=1 Tax=Thalassococcus sp. S3 TaxID=2017482 RepID=UPI00102455E4|nr:HAD-IA family hydrolase [Thalassococcus sp. S3]QBF30140.1 HAD family hydrolase [Thalassococcus sp. S3]